MKTNKCQKLVWMFGTTRKNMWNKNNKNPGQTLDLGLILEKVKRVTEFNQQAWLKPYIDMNTELKTNAKNEDW